MKRTMISDITVLQRQKSIVVAFLVMIASNVYADEYVIDQRFTSVASLNGKLFSIVNEEEGKAFCFPSAQDMAYSAYSDAMSANSYFFKLEAAQGTGVESYYYLRTYKPDGSVYAMWGDSNNGYLNSQEAKGWNCFSLGKTDKTNGQDIVNGAVWALEASDGKFAIKNIGTGKYLKDAAPAKYDTPTYFTLCTLKEKTETTIKPSKLESGKTYTMFNYCAQTSYLSRTSWDGSLVNFGADESSYLTFTAQKNTNGTWSFYYDVQETNGIVRYYLNLPSGTTNVNINTQSRCDWVVTNGKVTGFYYLEPASGNNTNAFGYHMHLNAGGQYIVVSYDGDSFYPDFDGGCAKDASGNDVLIPVKKANGEEIELYVMADSSSCNWAFVEVDATSDNVGNQKQIDAYKKALGAAQTIDQTAPMNASVLTTLRVTINKYSAIGTTSAEELDEATAALNDATADAEASIEAYTGVKGYLSKVREELENTNVYTAEAYNYWYSDVYSKYNNGEYTTDEAAEFAVNSAYYNGWHAANKIDDILLSAWTIGGWQCADFNTALYINTWSIEADGVANSSGMHVPFYEYWTSDDNSLDVNTLEATLTDLEAGTYEVEALVRVRIKDGSTDTPYGVTLSVNNGNKVNVCNGITCGDGTKFYYDTFKAKGIVRTDGVLKIDFNVSGNNNISWLAFKNVKYRIVSSEIVDDNAASIEAMKALLDDTNVYTAEAYDKYTEYFDKYEAGELSEVLVNPTEVQSWHSANVYDDLLLSAWTIGGEQCTDFNTALYINTWSIEADGVANSSGMHVPFYEYWTNDANSLGVNTLEAKLTNLEAGTYEVEALVRVRIKDGSTETPYGVTLSVNNGSKVNVCNGKTCRDGTQFRYDTFVATGTVGSDGVLKIDFNVSGNNNISWLAFKNVKYRNVSSETGETLESKELTVLETKVSIKVDDGDYYPGSTDAKIDVTTILDKLGAKSLSEVTIYAVQSDGTLDPDFKLGNTDGWRNSSGDWTTWNGSEIMLCVKLDDELNITYIGGKNFPDKAEWTDDLYLTATYRAVKTDAKNGDWVTFKVTLKVSYDENPSPDFNLSQLQIQATNTVDINLEVGTGYINAYASVDIADMLTKLGVNSLDDVNIYAVQSDGELDIDYQVGVTDGWRDVNGDWAAWGDATSQFYVKADFTRENGQLYEIGAHPDHSGKHLNESITYTATYAFVSGDTPTNNKAVILKVNLVFGDGSVNPSVNPSDVLEGATEDDPRDATSFIQNPDFENGNDDGWSISIGSTSASGYQGDSYTNGDVTISNFIQAWRPTYNNTNNKLGDGRIYTTVRDLPAGKYKIECDAISVFRIDGGGAPKVEGVTFYVTNSADVDMSCPVATEDYMPEHYSMVFAMHEAGTIEFGLKARSCNASWIAADNFRLTYYGPAEDNPDYEMLQALIRECVTKYPDVYGENVYANASIKEEYLEALDGARDAEADYAKHYENLSTALNNLETSIEEYSIVKSAIERCESEQKRFGVPGFEKLSDVFGDLLMNIEDGYNDGNVEVILSSLELDGKTFNLTIAELSGFMDKLITDYVKENVTASINNPIDVSVMVDNSTFDKAGDFSGWEGTGFTTIGTPSTNAGETEAKFNTYQDISGLPAGRYVAYVQGFYRRGTAKNCYTISSYDDDPQYGVNVDFYAVSSIDSTASKIQSCSSGAVDPLFSSQEYNMLKNYSIDEVGTGSGLEIGLGFIIPKDMEAANAWFNVKDDNTNSPYYDTKYYNNLIEVTVGDDGKLRIGVRKEESIDSDMSIFDNFRLYYLGNEELKCDKPVIARVGTTNNITIMCQAPLDPKIYYTTDGSIPTHESDVYDGVFEVSKNGVIKALAAKDQYDDSEITSFAVDWFKVTIPVFSLNDNMTLSINTTTVGASIYYTTDGSNPVVGNSNTLLYSGSITLPQTDITYKAIAVLDGYNNSDVATYTYMADDHTCAMPQILRVGNTIQIICDTDVATIYYTLDGSEPTTESNRYTSEVPVSENVTIKAIAVANGYFSSNVVTYTVDWFKAATPVFAYSDLTLTITTTDGADIYYTTDGSDPVVGNDGTMRYTDTIILSRVDMTVKAIGVKSGHDNSDIATYTYKAGDHTCATPQISHIGESNAVSITCSTGSVTIYYTLDGSEPTTDSNIYSGPFTLDYPCAVRAIAISTGWLPSEVAVMEWRPMQCAVPVIARAGDSDAISITCETSDVTIYYTTDGSEPTTESNVYSEPVDVEYNGTVYAMAVKDGILPSDVSRFEVDWMRAEQPAFALNGITLTITTATEGGTIYYYINGDTEHVLTYYGPIMMEKDYTSISAYTYKDLLNDSEVATFEFDAAEHTCEAPVVTRVGETNEISIEVKTEGSTIYYTTDGSMPNENSQIYNGVITVGVNCRVTAIAVRDDMFSSAPATLNVDWLSVYGVIADYNNGVLTLSCETPGAVIHYEIVGREDGDVTENSPTYTQPLVLTDNRMVKYTAFASGYNPVSGAFTPTDFKCEPVKMEYDGRNVSLYTDEADATIYYTTDGSQPTTASMVYSGPIALDGLCTIRAFDVKEFKNASDVMTEAIKYYFDGENYITAEAGNITRALESYDTDELTELTVSGKINNADLASLRQLTSLKHLNLKSASFEQGMVPDGAFSGMNIVSIELPRDISALGRVFDGCKHLAAIIWNAYTRIANNAADMGVENPNLLLYTLSQSYAPIDVSNVVVDDRAMKIILTDADDCGTFYCPREFVAGTISYTHNYTQTTEVGECRGWETLALPFDVQTITHEERTRPLTPFGANGMNMLPFWLCEFGEKGFVRATEIKANRPYIVSMPNNEIYAESYRLGGKVTYAATNATVPVTEPVTTSRGEKMFTPCFDTEEVSTSVFAINRCDNESGYVEGSVFLPEYRKVRPFEAYISIALNDGNTSFVPIRDDLPTDIIGVMYGAGGNGTHYDDIYDVSGRKINDVSNMQNGVYIINGKKVLIK